MDMQMSKIVHLDFKGAPLKVPYLEKVLSVIKLWGATGVLLEWEDTFPYHSTLADIGSRKNSGGDKLYSMEEVQHILKFAKNIGLEPIQLVQSIGHMEFVLKHQKFRELREIDQSPAVLCPTKPQSQELIRTMIEQVLEAQPDATYIHIGGDEVWHKAECQDCQTKIQNQNSNDAVFSLYMNHIRNLALFIKEKRPGLTVLIWDDMIRTVSFETLSHYALSEIVEPIIWNYNELENFNIDEGLLDTYGKLFPHVWAGSAYKGASGSCQVLAPVERYVSNQEAWVNVIGANKARVKFIGFVITGWSRYDHYATLCELMPVSLPSLCKCLRFLADGTKLTGEEYCEGLPSDQWPGEDLARCIYTFVVVNERCLNLLNSDIVKTWLNPWQIARRYIAPYHLKGIAVTGQYLTTELAMLQSKISGYLPEITGERSSEEWLMTYVAPILQKMGAFCEIAHGSSAGEPSVGAWEEIL